MNSSERHKQTLFVLIGGFIMTVLIIAVTLGLQFLRMENLYLVNAIIYVLEFGMYCLALYLYKVWVSKIIWFSNAVVILILLTVVKILLIVMILYIIFTLLGLFVEPGIGNLFGLMGPYVRGFIIELACIGVASKIFETDIFGKQRTENERIIDDL